MGGTSVTFNISGALLLCLIRDGFHRFFMARLLHICFCWMVSFVYEDGIS